MAITKEQARDIANTIAAQMGGYPTLKLMIGAEKFSFDMDGSLTFKFKMCTKANYCKVVLDPSDTYTMTFIRIRKVRNSIAWTRKEVFTQQGLYFDDLQPVFENFTGLTLTIPRIRGINV